MELDYERSIFLSDIFNKSCIVKFRAKMALEHMYLILLTPEIHKTPSTICTSAAGDTHQTPTLGSPSAASHRETQFSLEKCLIPCGGQKMCKKSLAHLVTAERNFSRDCQRVLQQLGGRHLKGSRSSGH